MRAKLRDCRPGWLRAWLCLVALWLAGPMKAGAQGPTGASELPLVVVLSTGGTIAGRGESVVAFEYLNGRAMPVWVAFAALVVARGAFVQVKRVVSLGK